MAVPELLLLIGADRRVHRVEGRLDLGRLGQGQLEVERLPGVLAQPGRGLREQVAKVAGLRPLAAGGALRTVLRQPVEVRAHHPGIAIMQIFAGEQRRRACSDRRTAPPRSAARSD